MEDFGIDEEEVAATDEADRLKRPWSVFIFGVVLSVGALAVLFVRGNGRAQWDDKVTVGLGIFTAVAVLLSGAYAFIGAKHSKKLAERITGTIGLVLILGGVAYIAYMVLVLAP